MDKVQYVHYYEHTENEHEQKLMLQKDDGEQQQSNLKHPDTLFLYFSIISGIFLSASTGILMTWSSPAVALLSANNTYINPIGRPIAKVEITMLLGIPQLCSLLGSLALPKCADLIGRKRILHFLSVGMLITTVGLALSNTVKLLITFLTIYSFLLNGVLPILLIYVLEICEEHNRIKHSCFIIVGLTLGQMYSYSIGSFLSFKYFTLVLGIPIALFVIFCFFLVESPTYLMIKENIDECKKALWKLRSNKSQSEIERDFTAIKNSVSMDKTSDELFIIGIFTRRELRVGIFWAMIPILTNVLSGVPMFLSLTPPIFQKIQIVCSPKITAILAGVKQVIGGIHISYTLGTSGRKVRLLISSLGIGVSIAILGTIFYLDHIQSRLIYTVPWLPFVIFAVYGIFYSVGVGPIPLAVTSELFSPKVRSSALAFIVTISSIFSAITTFGFPFLVNIMGMYWCLWIFAICSFVGFGLIFYCLPELKGKSLLELQETLRNY
ncbi:facilitated trehalose transporter Tret1-like [Diabrotica virgifera virgifera]|uniref:Major facilitator superfamily (MFS) profile domain-containing protein n=1 Tax=Diabrotica virgifera virgifera TaxID=50390 RepID=A0ABM5IGH8_DIAVI|nr:facilitated trehalose transporter Tret1-like [Diabrotica virgifera virgifera]